VCARAPAHFLGVRASRSGLAWAGGCGHEGACQLVQTLEEERAKEGCCTRHRAGL
jgi:hypothetical protein